MVEKDRYWKKSDPEVSKNMQIYKEIEKLRQRITAVSYTHLADCLALLLP